MKEGSFLMCSRQTYRHATATPPSRHHWSACLLTPGVAETPQVFRLSSLPFTI